MGLSVIGSGFGRTGTMSTKMALEQLGFGPCHPMTEVVENPNQFSFWKAYAEGQELDWAEVFADYIAQVDFPGAAVWHELSVAFPDARIIHTERPEEEWWASYSASIGKFFKHCNSLPLPPPVAAIFETMDTLLIQGVMGGLDKDSALSAYRTNNAKVRQVIPADRLLVFNPVDGWDPLCRFLSVETPKTEFPRSNSRSEFWTFFGGEPAAA